MKQIFPIFIEDIGFLINDDLDESELLEGKAFDDLKPLVHNGKYRSYWTVTPHLIHGSSFYIRFYFEDSKFKSLQLHSAFKDGSSNNIQDLAALEHVKKLNDQWLKDRFGVILRKDEPWGSVESFLDKKSWSASIIFRFSG